MTDSPDSSVERRNPTTSCQSSIPIRSIYLQSFELSDASITANRPSTSFCLNIQWKFDKRPAQHTYAALNHSTLLEPAWIRIPTEEPLSPGLRAEVREDLIKSWHFDTMEIYRRTLKNSWFYEGHFLTIKGSVTQLESRMVRVLCNNLTSFYWMPSPEFDGRHLPTLPFGCIFKEWFKYHNNEPNIDFGNFFAHLVRVYPTAPTTVQGIVEAHQTLCNEAAALLLERTNHDEPQNYNLKPTYRAIITIMDRHVDPDRELTRFVVLEEHSKNQTILLVRTGDESHLSAPISFETLRANGLCLPIDRTDVPAAGNDVVRVSLANAVKFVADLQQKEDMASPQPRISPETERQAKEWADKQLKEADDKGIDNTSSTWSSVRRVKATKMGGTFDELEPHPFNTFWR